MNKIIPLIAILDVIAAGGVSGCHKEKNSDWERIKTNETKLTLSVNGGTDSVWTTNYARWWISEIELTDIDSLITPDPNESNDHVNADWLVLDNNQNKLYIHSEPNTTQSRRKAIVTMTVGDVFKNIHIIQEAK